MSSFTETLVSDSLFDASTVTDLFSCKSCASDACVVHHTASDDGTEVAGLAGLVLNVQRQLQVVTHFDGVGLELKIHTCFSEWQVVLGRNSTTLCHVHGLSLLETS